MARKKKKTEEAGFDQGGPRKRVTPVDVQEKVFRLSFRGYNEQDVDEYLDHITEELAALHEENKRLREGGEPGAGGSPEAARLAEQQAAETVRQAREYAARLRAEAESGTGSGGGLGGTFLIRERDFLQQMAALIQGHAEALKADARRVRPAQAGGGGTMAAQPEATDVSPVVSGEPESPAAMPPEAPMAAAPSTPSGEVDWPLEDTQAHDPLLEEWDGGVAGGPEDQPYPERESGPEPTGDLFGDNDGPPEPKRPESEPSLRELFWGEE